MQCKDIMAMIEGTYPKSAALGFDNVGLQAGRSEKEVRRIYLALDTTDAVIEEAIAQEADMLITHHPLIFTTQRNYQRRPQFALRMQRATIRYFVAISVDHFTGFNRF